MFSQSALHSETGTWEATRQQLKVLQTSFAKNMVDLFFVELTQATLQLRVEHQKHMQRYHRHKEELVTSKHKGSAEQWNRRLKEEWKRQESSQATRSGAVVRGVCQSRKNMETISRKLNRCDGGRRPPSITVKGRSRLCERERKLLEKQAAHRSESRPAASRRPRNKTSFAHEELKHLWIPPKYTSACRSVMVSSCGAA